MDFITSLLEAQGFDVVLVVVDCLSKLAHMVPTRGIITVVETAKLFLDT
jgi:hypothetical protein